MMIVPANETAVMNAPAMKSGFNWNAPISDMNLDSLQKHKYMALTCSFCV